MFIINIVEVVLYNDIIIITFLINVDDIMVYVKFMINFWEGKI